MAGSESVAQFKKGVLWDTLVYMVANEGAARFCAAGESESGRYITAECQKPERVNMLEVSEHLRHKLEYKEEMLEENGKNNCKWAIS